MLNTNEPHPNPDRFTNEQVYVCFQGKPRPIATWLKDGQPVDEKKVSVRTSNVDSILFIRSAERDHSGKYTLVLKIENMEDSATIDIRIVGKTKKTTCITCV